MRFHRFYSSEVIGAKTEVTIHSADLVNQIRRVFRLKKGDSVILFDGSGSDFTCRIEEIGKNDINFVVSSVSKSHYLPENKVTLCAAIVKKDTFEWIVEKATELGITKIIPLLTERTEKKAINDSRLKKIAVEASEQSGRGDVPEIGSITSLHEMLKLKFEVQISKSEVNTKPKIQMVAFHTEGEALNDSARRGLAESLNLQVFVGPEGGWSPDEIKWFHDNKIPVYSLGNQVLRAETAVVGALSLILLGK